MDSATVIVTGIDSSSATWVELHSFVGFASIHKYLHQYPSFEVAKDPSSSVLWDLTKVITGFRGPRKPSTGEIGDYWNKTRVLLKGSRRGEDSNWWVSEGFQLHSCWLSFSWWTVEVSVLLGEIEKKGWSLIIIGEGVIAIVVGSKLGGRVTSLRD